MNRNRVVHCLIGVVLLGSAPALAACGGDEGSKPTSTGSDSPSSGVVDEAKRAVKRLSTPPTSIGVSEPLKGSVRGKAVAYMQCLAPVCAILGDEIKAAAPSLGIKLKVFSTGATPDKITAAYNNAVASRPDAVISSALPTAIWARQLAAFAEQGTPVITNITVAKPSAGVTAQYFDAAYARGLGADTADWIVADSDGSAKTLMVYAPEFTGTLPEVGGYQARLGETCPKCSVDRVQVKATDVGSVVPKRVVSYLQQHPDVKYVVFQYGDLATGVPQALQTAGITGIKTVTTAGGAVNYQYIKDGQQTADLSVYLDVYGWQLADGAARAMLRQPVKGIGPPNIWITKATSDFDPKGQPPFGDPDWRAEFEQLWEASAPGSAP